MKNNNDYMDDVVILLNCRDKFLCKDKTKDAVKFNKSVLSLVAFFTLCNGDIPYLRHYFFENKWFNDFGYTELVCDILVIPFDYSLLPIKYYNFIKGLSETIVLPLRIDDLGHFIDNQNQSKNN